MIPPAAPRIDAQETTRRPGPVLMVLALTACLDMLGQLIVVPLLPFWTQRHGGDAMALGLVTAAFPLAQLVASPVWGGLSDRRGRRPVLMLGLAASIAGYAVFMVADRIWLLLLARLVQGAGGGTVGVVQAVVSDTTPPSRRIAALGWLSAATSAGVMLGPVLGSLASGWGPSAPGAVAGALGLANLALVWFLLPESRAGQTDGERPTVRGLAVVQRVLRTPLRAESRLVWIYFVGMSAFNAMVAVMALHLARRFGITERTIGTYYLYVGALALIVRGAVLGPVAARLGETALFRLGVATLAVGLAGIPFAGSYRALLAVVTLTPFGTAFLFPCVTARLSRLAPSDQRGAYLGAQHTFGALARIAAPVWACWSYDRLATSVPFVVAAVLAVGAGALWSDATPAGAP